MAIIKKKELKNMTKEELNKKLEELKLELMKERASAYAGVAKNHGKIRELKKTIARIYTFQNEKIIKGKLK